MPKDILPDGVMFALEELAIILVELEPILSVLICGRPWLFRNENRLIICKHDKLSFPGRGVGLEVLHNVFWDFFEMKSAKDDSLMLQELARWFETFLEKFDHFA